MLEAGFESVLTVLIGAVILSILHRLRPDVEEVEEETEEQVSAPAPRVVPTAKRAPTWPPVYRVPIVPPRDSVAVAPAAGPIVLRSAGPSFAPVELPPFPLPDLVETLTARARAARSEPLDPFGSFWLAETAPLPSGLRPGYLPPLAGLWQTPLGEAL